MNEGFQDPRFETEHPSQDDFSPATPAPELQHPFPEPPYPSKPNRPVPFATLTIIALCVLVFILQTIAGGSQNPNVLLEFGASYGPYFKQGQYWRAVMPMFLHIGLWHLLVNMYVLYLLGPILEQMYGYGRYALIYVAAGIGGSLLSMFHGHNIVAAGASGAIMGVVGAVLVAGYLHRNSLAQPLARVFRRRTLVLTLLVFVVIQLVSGFLVSNIDNWGHVGGLAVGAAMAFLIPPPRLAEAAGSFQTAWPYAMQSERPSQAVVWIPVAIVAISMAAAGSHYRVEHSVSRLLDEGRHLQSANQTSQAIDRYKRASQLDPRDERPHEALAGLYLQQRRFSDAIDEYNQVLRVNPDSMPAQIGLAAAYQGSGELAKAQKIFENLLGRNPRNAAAQEALGDLLAGQKLYSQAVEHYQRALRLSPQMAVAHNNLAWLYATAEDPRVRNSGAALDHARQAVKLTGWQEPEFIDTLAEALYANRDYAEAVKVQGEALKLAPRNREFQDHMARYRKAAGV